MLRCSRCAASTSSSRAPRRSCPRPRAPVRRPRSPASEAPLARGRWRCSSLTCRVLRRHRRGAGGDLRHPPAAPGPHRPARRAGPAPPRPALRTRQHGAAVGGGREAQHGHHRQLAVRLTKASQTGWLFIIGRSCAEAGLCAAGTSRSYAIPPSRALRLAATGPWPPSPDSPEPAMGKTEGEKLYQWQLCHHHHSAHVQTFFCTAATDSPAPTPCQVSTAHSTVMSSASRAPAVLARPAASSAHRNHPVHTTSSQQPVSNTM